VFSFFLFGFSYSLPTQSLRYASPSSALAGGSGEIPVQTRCPDIQTFAAPPYLADEFHRSSDVEARSRLRSASSSSLIIRPTGLSTVGDRAFPIAAARVWNELARHVTSAPSPHQVCCRPTKTHLFSRFFLRLFLCSPRIYSCYYRARYSLLLLTYLFVTCGRPSC